jgi:uncharacterized iron-regulated membrane protein
MQILIALAIVLIPLISITALVVWIARVLELDSGSMPLPQRPPQPPH